MRDGDVTPSHLDEHAKALEVNGHGDLIHNLLKA